MAARTPTPPECRYGPQLRVRRFGGPYLQQTSAKALEEFLRLTLDRVPKLVADLRPSHCINLTGRPRANVRCIESRYGYDEPHHHSHAEIVLVVSGRFLLVLDDEGYLLRAGDVVLLPPNQVHCDGFINASTPYALLWHGLRPVNFAVHLTRYVPRGGQSRYESLGHVLFPATATASMTEALCRPPLKLDRIKEALLYFAYHTVAAMQQDDLAQAAKHPLVIEALRIAQRESVTPLSVAGVAKRLQVTPNYFSALFVREVGVSFTQHLQRLRLSRVPALLQDPTLQVKAVGRACGFQSSYYFTRLFKESHGVTPSEYRRCLQSHFV